MFIYTAPIHIRDCLYTELLMIQCKTPNNYLRPKKYLRSSQDVHLYVQSLVLAEASSIRIWSILFVLLNTVYDAL